MDMFDPTILARLLPIFMLALAAFAAAIATPQFQALLEALRKP